MRLDNRVRVVAVDDRYLVLGLVVQEEDRTENRTYKGGNGK